MLKIFLGKYYLTSPSVRLSFSLRMLTTVFIKPSFDWSSLLILRKFCYIFLVVWFSVSRLLLKNPCINIYKTWIVHFYWCKLHFDFIRLYYVISVSVHPLSTVRTSTKYASTDWFKLVISFIFNYVRSSLIFIYLRLCYFWVVGL